MDEDSLSIIEEEMEQLEVSASGDTVAGLIWGKKCTYLEGTRALLEASLRQLIDKAL